MMGRTSWPALRAPAETMLYINIMHTTHLRKVGGSVMVTLPPALLHVMRLEPGAAVGLTVRSGRLIVEPKQRPRYTLDELLARCDSSTRFTKREREWLDGRPVGREIL